MCIFYLVNPVVKFSFKVTLMEANIFLINTGVWASNFKGPLQYLAIPHQTFGMANLEHLRISRINCIPDSQTKAREVVLSYIVCDKVNMKFCL